MSTRSNYVFVYGTLKRSMSNHRYLEGATFIGRGTLHDFGIFCMSGFPGIVPKDDCYVVGEIYKVDTESIWDRMDTLEGVSYRNPRTGLYRRETHTVLDADGVEIPCEVYIYNTQNLDRNFIGNGVWTPPKRSQ